MCIGRLCPVREQPDQPQLHHVIYVKPPSEEAASDALPSRPWMSWRETARDWESMHGEMAKAEQAVAMEKYNMEPWG